jgi:hypothetical protein
VAAYILHPRDEHHVLDLALYKYLHIIGYSVQKNTKANSKDFKTLVVMDHACISATKITS